MEQEKKCENCKFFCVHYVKTKTRFSPLNEGHCTRGKIYLKKTILSDNCCEKWESNGEVKKENRENIIAVLRSMRTSLNNIENILKDDLKPD